MTAIRLVCRLADGTERKVITAAADYTALESAASNKLGCSESDVIIEIRDGEEFWEVDEAYWPAIEANQTIYARSRGAGVSAARASPPPPAAAASTSTSTKAQGRRTKKRANNDAVSADGDAAAPESTADDDRRPGKQRKKTPKSDGDGGKASDADASAGVSATAGAIAGKETPHPGASGGNDDERKRKRGKSKSTRRQSDERGDGGSNDTTVPPSSSVSAALPTSSRGVAIAAANGRSAEAWKLDRIAPPITTCRRTWTQREDTLLWEKLREEIARRRREYLPIITQIEVFEKIVELHGATGTKTQALRGRTASALLTRARNRVEEAVKNKCPVPPDLLALFKYREIIQPGAAAPPAAVAPSSTTGKPSGKKQSRELVHAQRSEGPRRFGMASMVSAGARTPASSVNTSRSSSSAADDRTTTTATRSTIVVRDSSEDGDEDPGNESEWQSDVPQPTTDDGDSESETSDDDDGQGTSLQNSHKVQRMWGGRPLPSIEYNQRPLGSGGATAAGPPRVLPAAQGRGPDASGVHTRTFPSIENAQRTRAQQAALNPFARRNDGSGGGGGGGSSSNQDMTTATTPPSAVVKTEAPEDRIPDATPTTSATSTTSNAPNTPQTSGTAPQAPLKREDSPVAASEDELDDTSQRNDPAIPDTAASSRRASRYALAPGGNDHDLLCIEAALSDKWGLVRRTTALIVRSCVKPDTSAHSTLDLADIDYPRAGMELAYLLADVREKELVLQQDGSPSQSSCERVKAAYQAVALAIAFEVFGTLVPPQWSVRRTSFAVAGYFVAAKRAAVASPLPDAPPRLGMAGRYGMRTFLFLGQKIFWATASAAPGSGLLEQESADITAAMTFGLDDLDYIRGYVGGFVRDATHRAVESARGANAQPSPRASGFGQSPEQAVAVIRRALDVLDKLEASRSFLERCDIPVRQWGVPRELRVVISIDQLSQNLSGDVIGTRAASQVRSDPFIKSKLESLVDAQMAVRARVQALVQARVISRGPGSPSGKA